MNKLKESVYNLGQIKTKHGLLYPLGIINASVRLLINHPHTLCFQRRNRRDTHTNRLKYHKIQDVRLSGLKVYRYTISLLHVISYNGFNLENTKKKNSC